MSDLIEINVTEEVEEVQVIIYENASGASAYEVALANGFVGTLSEWLDSLIGPVGPTGAQGDQGIQGPTGPQGATGPQGLTGNQGPIGATGSTGLQGSPGIDGREIEFQKNSTHIQWRYVGDVSWIDLVLLTDIKGDQGIQGNIGPQGSTGATGTQGIQGVQGIQGLPGTNGIDGADGREIQLQKSSTHIQWRYVGDVIWTNLVLLTDIKGETGATGATGAQGIQGIKGDTGNQGIQGLTGPQGPSGVVSEASVSAVIHSATNKPLLVDGDEVVGTDSANAFGLIRTTWGSIKTFLKTYFDTQYILKESSGYVDIDFGFLTSDENDSVSTTVSFPSLTADNRVICFPSGIATADHDPDDYLSEGLMVYPSNLNFDVGFDVNVLAPEGTFGIFRINYQVL